MCDFFQGNPRERTCKRPNFRNDSFSKVGNENAVSLQANSTRANTLSGQPTSYSSSGATASAAANWTASGTTADSPAATATNSVATSCITSTLETPSVHVQLQELPQQQTQANTTNTSHNPFQFRTAANPDELQRLINENFHLKERVAQLERAIESHTANKNKEKVFYKGKPYSSLSPKRKIHKKKEIREFLKNSCKKLPPDWKIEEVRATLCRTPWHPLTPDKLLSTAQFLFNKILHIMIIAQ